MPIPDREQQIRMAHAMLINQVVMSCSNSDGRAELESILEIAIQQGWSEMVRVIRMIVSGNRNESLLNGLDLTIIKYHCCPVNLKYIAVQQMQCLAIRVF